MRKRLRLMVAFFAVALFIAGIAGSVSAHQTGLVNVKIGNVCALCGNDIQIVDVVDLVATVCPNTDIEVIEAAVANVASSNQENQTTVCKTVLGENVVVFNH